uniref:Uncharacterized protein n=1 Tax=Oryza meridionalis TaxID=40149 RepID=A0A0E0BWH0_9ORYZ
MNSSRRQEGNPLDLNNLPDEFGKQTVESSTTTAASSAEASKRETETLNRARQLVFGNDSLAAVGAQLNFRDVNMGGGGAAAPPPTLQMGGGFRGGGVGGDPCIPLRPVQPRQSPPQPPPYHHYLYTTTAPPSALHPMNYPATYPAPPRHQQPAAVGDYVIGHAVSASDALVVPPPPQRASFSCFGAPLAVPPANVQPDNGNCNCSFGCGHSNRNMNAAS